LKKKESEFIVRRATLRDLDTLVEQRHKMWKDIRQVTPKQHRIADDVYRKWVVEMVRRRRFAGFLALTKEGKKPVAGGCVWIKEVHPSPWSSRRRTPYLMSMYTDPSFRGNGLATEIVNSAMKWSEQRGFPSLSLHASKMGRMVYSRLGFEQTNEMRIRFPKKKSRPKG